MVSLSEKYCPKKITEIVNQKLAIAKMLDFLNNFESFKKKGIILHGPAGSGKTCSVYAIADELEYDIVQLNADDFRDKESVEKIIGSTVSTGSLFGRKKLVLIDELESFSRNDTGGLPAIIKLIRISKFPVILIALDIWDKKFMALRFCCESAEFKRILPVTIKAHLQRVLEREEVKCAPEVIDFIAKNSDGDLRAALNDLDVLVHGKKAITKEDLKFIEERPKESRIFSSVQQIFQADSAKSAKDVFERGDIDFDTLKLWLDENIANEYHTPAEVADAYDKASRSDVFSGRINRRQEWSLQKYVIDLEVAGIPAAKRTPSRTFTRYSPPSKINALFRTKAERAMLKSISLKVAKKSHTSAHIAQQTYVPMLKIALKHSKSSKQLAEQLGLEAEEVAFLTK